MFLPKSKKLNNSLKKIILGIIEINISQEYVISYIKDNINDIVNKVLHDIQLKINN